MVGAMGHVFSHDTPKFHDVFARYDTARIFKPRTGHSCSPPNTNGEPNALVVAAQFHGSRWCRRIPQDRNEEFACAFSFLQACIEGISLTCSFEYDTKRGIGIAAEAGTPEP
jgi:hypothetical protein